MKTFTKPECNICLKENLMTLKRYTTNVYHTYEKTLVDIWGLHLQDYLPLFITTYDGVRPKT